MLTNSIILFRNRIIVAHQQEATTEMKHYIRASEAIEFSLMRQRGTLSVRPCVLPFVRPWATTPTPRGNRLRIVKFESFFASFEESKHAIVYVV